MTNVLERPLVPVANPEDAVATYEELRPYLPDTDVVPIVVHVIEKAGGAPDKAGVEQRREVADEMFELVRNLAEMDDVDVDTEILYGTDVAGAIHAFADETDASAIVFRSRGGRRWLDLVSGNVRSKLIRDLTRPVVVLPDTQRES